jgi:hypothetical protein
MSTETRSQMEARDEVPVQTQQSRPSEEEAAATSGESGCSSEEDVADATEATFQAPKSRPDDKRLGVMLAQAERRKWETLQFRTCDVSSASGMKAFILDGNCKLLPGREIS